MMTKKEIIVIGSGFGGLAAATRLAAKGHKVTLFEKRDQLGGRGYQYHINGFKFDGGPTVITAPYMFDEIWESAGRSRDDYFELVPLDPYYRIFNEHGEYFDYWREQEMAEAEIAKWEPEDVEGFRRFVAGTRDIFSAFFDATEQPFLNFSDMLKILPDMVRLRAMGNMYRYASRYLKNDFLRRVCSFHPLLVGGSPLSTPSIFSLIIQFEKQWGVHYAIGGTGKIVSAFGELLTELGADIYLNAEVDKILIDNGKASGVKLKDGSIFQADIVVTNSDAAFTYRNMIPQAVRPAFKTFRLSNMAYSNSLVVIYFGTKKRYLDSKLSHHNIIFGERYQSLLHDIFRKKKLTDDFGLYLHMPTITDESIAPEGCESFYVLSLVPNLDNPIDWKEMLPTYTDKILGFLEENYLPDLRENIIAQHAIDPLHFQNTLNSYKGAAFSVEPLLVQSAWMRPHNRCDHFKDLYFVGASTHPGAGIPSVLATGKIAANLIDPTPVMRREPVIV